MNPCQMLWSPRKSRDKGFCWSLFTVTKGRMAKLLLRIIICLILCVFSVKAQAQASHKWTHQGNVWVVTMDHSTSMRSVLCSPERLTQALRRCGFDYAHDYFLLVLAGVDRIGEGDFGGQLLHICDSGRFAHAEALSEAIQHCWKSTSPRYGASYVSLLSYYSVAVGACEMQRMGKSRDYADIRVITITSDALEHDDWNLDQRGLRAAGVLEQALKVKHALLSNEGGAGTLDRFYADETAVPYIRAYRYHTKQSQSIESKEDNRWGITRRGDGSVCICLLEKEIPYGVAEVCYLQELKVNRKHYPLDTLWDLSAGDSLVLPLGCRDAWVNNRFELKGALRISYQDSIYGPHYKEVNFDCQGKARSELFGVWSKWVVRGAIGLIVLYLLIRLVIIPWRRLCVIYVAGRKFVVRRSFARRWRQRRPLLVCEVDGAGQVCSVRVGDWRRVRVGRRPHIHQTEVLQDSYFPMEHSIMLVSRYPVKLQTIADMGMRKPIVNVSELEVPSGVFMESVSSKVDIGQHYIGQARCYPAWVEWRYGKSWSARLRGCQARWLNLLGDMLAGIAPEHYTCVVVGKGEMERLVVSYPKLRMSGFIEFHQHNE